MTQRKRERRAELSFGGSGNDLNNSLFFGTDSDKRSPSWLKQHTHDSHLCLILRLFNCSSTGTITTGFQSNPVGFGLVSQMN